MWPLIAVAIVRRKNFRSLNTNLFFGIVSGRDTLELVDWRSVDAVPVAVRSVELAACDFLRRIGHAGPLSWEVGAGGSGEELISPIRSRVKVSCAFVGTPANSVLIV
jgi:hypothetical protein